MSSQRERRTAVGIILGTLALSALFLAQGTTRLVAAATLGPQEGAAPVATGRPPGPAAAALRDRENPDPILKKNIFDSETGDLTATPAEDLMAEGGEETEGAGEVRWPDDPASVQSCSGGTRLVGTIVAPDYPEWSFAAVAEGSTEAMLYRTGMEIGGKTLVGIQGNLVYMAPPSGTVCKLQMFDPGNRAEPSSPAVAEDDARKKELAKKREARRRRRGKDGPISDEELAQGIQKVTDTEYNIDRSLVNKILENQAELMRSARIIPHEQGGRVQGVKLYGIRRSSILGKLGVQNGDMLRNINGFDMSSPDSALEAYTKLRNADHLTVAVVRRGEPMTIDYNIQ